MIKPSRIRFPNLALAAAAAAVAVLPLSSGTWMGIAFGVCRGVVI